MNTISSAELFAMQLPCLPKSKQGIEYQAKKGCWAFVEQNGVGRGGKLKRFIVNELPNDVSQIVLERQANVLLEQLPQVIKNPVSGSLKAQKAKMTAISQATQLALPLN